MAPRESKGKIAFKAVFVEKASSMTKTDLTAWGATLKGHQKRWFAMFETKYHVDPAAFAAAEVSVAPGESRINEGGGDDGEDESEGGGEGGGDKDVHDEDDGITALKKKYKTTMDVTRTNISDMWKLIEEIEPAEYDRELFEVFAYQGFDPYAIVTALVDIKMERKIPDDDFKKDLLMLSGLAAVKGSVNDHNVKKMSAEGLELLVKLEKTYKIKRGSGRRENPTVLTISRIGAAFPNKIIQLIHSNKISTRKFHGPFKSASLPDIMRHQSFASIIPTTMNDKIKTYLLNLIVAFSADQSICIAPIKSKVVESLMIFDRQRSFIQVAHDNPYPRAKERLKIFALLKLNHNSLLTCAKATKLIVEDVDIPTQEEFDVAIAAFTTPATTT